MHILTQIRSYRLSSILYEIIGHLQSLPKLRLTETRVKLKLS